LNFTVWVTFTEWFSGVRGHNLTKLDEDIGQSWLHKKFVAEFQYLVAFLNASGSKLSDL